MKYVGDNLWLVLVCLVMCGCAATENRSALSTPASFNRMRWQAVDTNVVKSKTTIWDYLPWAAAKKTEEKKAASYLSQVQVSTDSPRSDRGAQNEITENAKGHAVQYVNWETRTHQPDQAESAVISDRQNHIPLSRLPTNTLWR
ncbi:MAG: hypothetical protein VX970_03460 [Planctomycetota bacterium]|nr:hypothetical protein [Planctomycetota bacterium]